MEQLVIEAHIREDKGKSKVKVLRRGGFIPAVIYGEGKKTQLLKIERRPFMRLLHEHRAESVVFNIKIVSDSKQAKAIPAIIKEMQHEPISDEIVHVDFNEISLTKVIKVRVPIEARGEALGIKQEGGSLEHVLWDLEIECLPTQIPKHIEVDISALKIGDAVHIKDISLPPEIKVLHDPDAVVLSVAAPLKEEVVEAVAGEAASTEPEVIKEKKEETPAEEKDEKKEKPKEKAPAKEEKA